MPHSNGAANVYRSIGGPLAPDLLACKSCDKFRCGGVKADDVHHAGIIRISDREGVGDHPHDDQAGRNVGALTVLPQRLGRMNAAGPRLVVGVDHECVYHDTRLQRP